MGWFLKLISRLPLRFLQVLGAGIGGLAFRWIPVLRKRTNTHLDYAGLNAPGLDAKVGRNVGRQSLESIWIWYRPVDEVCQRITVSPETRERFDRILESGRPVVFLTPHIGSFEILPIWFAHTYFPKTQREIAVLFKPPKKAILQKVVGEGRQAPGIVLCPSTMVGVKRILKTLRAGGCFGGLPDQVPTKGDGAWAYFFGQPAYTMTFPLRVAKQFEADRMFVWSVREKDGWRLESRDWNEPLTGDAQIDARAMNAQLEAIVREAPEQYGWSYHRYKNPGVTPPPETLPT